jgi:type IV pilus assembly protein PilC
MLLAAAAVCVPSLRKKFRHPRQDDRGLQRKLHTARFVQALSMALRSGMTDGEALSLAMELTEDAPNFRLRCEACRTAVDGGTTLPAALRESELLTAAQCRLLETARLGGTGEAAMEQLANRLLDDSAQALEERTAGVEPAVVAVLSVLVGVILLSVMVPLMQIMTAIG